ncbi:hypothetical protein KIPB_009133 [Kipferlia bialata]|uniref:Ig-like domain-containing protein n=1 Tax=Kipferlia bialata TaxID=797122 RepID=A0A391NXW9_9EUKA|nr:hypothetical protein KIPB_009133 [Kipferlia bialata]|eukprot:g9133.t1
MWHFDDMSIAGPYTVGVFLDGSSTPFMTKDFIAGVYANTSLVCGSSALEVVGTDTSPYGVCETLQFTFTHLDVDGAVIPDNNVSAISADWTGPNPASYHAATVSHSGPGVYTITTTAPSAPGTHTLTHYVEGLLVDDISIDVTQQMSDTHSTLSVPSPVALGSTISVSIALKDGCDTALASEVSVSVSWLGVTYSGTDVAWDGYAYSLSLSAPTDFTAAGTYPLSVYVDGSASPLLSETVCVGLQAGSTWVYGAGPLTLTGGSATSFGTCDSIEYTFTLLDIDGSVIDADLLSAVSALWTGMADTPSTSLSYSGSGVYTLTTTAPSE